MEEVINFGRSIIVPSVLELSKDSSLSQIPPRYDRLDQDPPVISGTPCSLQSVPVIDLHGLVLDEGSMDSELTKLHRACKDWGFFQVVNHGVSIELLEKFKLEIQNFFKLSYEEKKKLWQQPDNQEGFGQLFVVSPEQKLDWSDMFYITTLPLNLRRNELFPKLPPILREILESYSAEMKKLALKILGYMGKALRMDEEETKDLFEDGVQTIRMNYYPPCPEPDKAIGFTPHSDADALTILLQLNETQGLEIRKEGKWVPISPLPNAFVVNVGDIMEIASNGIYRSIEHRATVNSNKERLSVATFYTSRVDSVIGPAPSLISQEKPAVFRRVPMEDYFKEFFARKLNGKSYIDFMRIEEQSKV